MAQIRIENVRKDFGTFNAVKSSTFTIEDGEFFMPVSYTHLTLPTKA